jgi:ATP synthase protein I
MTQRRPERPPLAQAVERRRLRRDEGRRQGERPLAQNLALAGTLGWLVAIPTLLGAFLGRTLDRRLGTHVTFTAALLFAGVALGSWFLWRKVHSE